MKFKKYLAIALASTMAIAAVGCGSSSSDSGDTAATTAATESSGSSSTEATTEAAAETATEATTESNTLNVANNDTSGTSVEGNYTPEDGATIELFTLKQEVVGVMDEIIADFEAKYPGVTVTQTAVSDAETVLATRLAANDIPDVMQVMPAGRDYQEYYDAGYLMDLTNESFMQNVDSSLLAMTEYNGIQFCLPETVSTYGIYYRKDIFEECGITQSPQTYDEFLEDLQILQDAGYETPVAFDFKESAPQITERVMGAIDPDCNSSFEKVASGEMDIADCQVITAYAQFLSDIAPYRTVDALGMDRDSALSDVVNGKSVLMFNGSWLLSQFLEADPNIDLGYCPIPSPLYEGLKVPVNVDTAYAIGADTEYPEACKALVDYLSQTDVAQKYYEVDGNINMIKGVSYDKEQLMECYDVVMNGGGFITVGNTWPTWDLRTDLAAAAQGYVGDEDLEEFEEACEEAIDTYYNE